jgi:hypothetical protein
MKQYDAKVLKTKTLSQLEAVLYPWIFIRQDTFLLQSRIPFLATCET